MNFPHIPDQKARLAAHADNVLNVSGINPIRPWLAIDQGEQR